MTKNNRFKKEVRAYQKAFNVTYMQALEKVSKHYIVTPDMEDIVTYIAGEVDPKRGIRYTQLGAVLFTGVTASGKSFLQHYVAKELVENHSLRVIHETRDEELNEVILPGLGLEDAIPGSIIFNPVSESAVKYFGGDDEYFYRQILRMRPDVISMPEVNDSTVATYDLLLEAITMGHTLLGTYHSSDPYTVMDRFYAQWEGYFTNLEDEANDTVQRLRKKENISEHLSAIVDVSRVVVNNKSLILASKYDVTPAVVEAWMDGRLKDYLNAQGFVSAADKKAALLKSLEN